MDEHIMSKFFHYFCKPVTLEVAEGGKVNVLRFTFQGKLVLCRHYLQRWKVSQNGESHCVFF